MVDLIYSNSMQLELTVLLKYFSPTAYTIHAYEIFVNSRAVRGGTTPQKRKSQAHSLKL